MNLTDFFYISNADIDLYDKHTFVEGHGPMFKWINDFCENYIMTHTKPVDAEAEEIFHVDINIPTKEILGNK